MTTHKYEDVYKFLSNFISKHLTLFLFSCNGS